MAFVIIQLQPQSRSVESTLRPINFQFAVQPVADTLNVISQVQYNNAGTWTDWGGKMRSPEILGNAGRYSLQIADVVNSLPKGEADGIRQLGAGNCYGSGGVNSLPQNYWAMKSNWRVRVQVQREFLDASTGFIELDPDITTSYEFNIHEGASPVKNGLWGTGFNVFSNTLAEYVMASTPNDGTDGGFLWLTDNVYIKRGRFRFGQYKSRIRESEQFLLNTFNGRLIKPVVLDNRLLIQTIGQNGAVLNSRNVTWLYGFGTLALDGMNTIDVGFRSIKTAYTPSGAEGTGFENVFKYRVVNEVQNSLGNAWIESSQWMFTIDRTCKGKGYQRFMWKNQLGGWDMFSSEGKLESRRKILRKKFQKRRGRKNNIEGFGQNNWLNTEDEIMKIESQPMTTAEAMWFSKISASALCYVRIDMDSDFNPQSFGDFNSYETWRDDYRCNGYISIIILSGSVKVANSTKGMQKVSFEYTYANRNLFPRM